MSFFAIRHIPTGGYLPEVNVSTSGRRVGYTASEPTRDAAPRLFPDRASARRSLTVWLKGAQSVSRYHDSYTGEYDENWHLEVRPHRRPEYMEIVEIAIVPVRKTPWNERLATEEALRGRPSVVDDFLPAPQIRGLRAGRVILDDLACPAERLTEIFRSAARPPERLTEIFRSATQTENT